METRASLFGIDAIRTPQFFVEIDFYAEPSPQVELRKVGRSWHLGKVLFEKWWLTPVGVRRDLLRLALLAGGRASGVRMEL